MNLLLLMLQLVLVIVDTAAERSAARVTVTAEVGIVADTADDAPRRVAGVRSAAMGRRRQAGDAATGVPHVAPAPPSVPLRHRNAKDRRLIGRRRGNTNSPRDRPHLRAPGGRLVRGVAVTRGSEHGASLPAAVMVVVVLLLLLLPDRGPRDPTFRFVDVLVRVRLGVVRPSELRRRRRRWRSRGRRGVGKHAVVLVRPSRSSSTAAASHAFVAR